MKKLLLLSFLISSYFLYGQQRFEFTHIQMGTQFTISMYAQDSIRAKKAALAAFNQIDRINQIMSTYVTDSEVNILSKSTGTNKKTTVSKDLLEVLSFAKQVSKKTNGAFDVTIGEANRLWKKAFKERRFPELYKIEQAKKTIGYETIKLDKRHHSATLIKEDTKIDLGGIAKGYAIDKALKTLEQHHIKQALVTTENDMAASDPPPNKVGWLVLVPNFQKDKTIKYDTAFLNNKAISISGVSDTYLDWGGRRFYPTINPFSALGIIHQHTITVVANSCMESDALATAFSVMDKRTSEKLLLEFENVYLLIQEPGIRHTFSSE